MVVQGLDAGAAGQVVLAWLAVGDVVTTSSTRASGRATATAAAAASHLNTGLLLASGSGGITGPCAHPVRSPCKRHP